MPFFGSSQVERDRRLLSKAVKSSTGSTFRLTADAKSAHPASEPLTEGETTAHCSAHANQPQRTEEADGERVDLESCLHSSAVYQRLGTDGDGADNASILSSDTRATELPEGFDPSDLLSDSRSPPGSPATINDNASVASQDTIAIQLPEGFDSSQTLSRMSSTATIGSVGGPEGEKRRYYGYTGHPKRWKLHGSRKDWVAEQLFMRGQFSQEVEDHPERFKSDPSTHKDEYEEEQRILELLKDDTIPTGSRSELAKWKDNNMIECSRQMRDRWPRYRASCEEHTIADVVNMSPITLAEALEDSLWNGSHAELILSERNDWHSRAAAGPNATVNWISRVAWGQLSREGPARDPSFDLNSLTEAEHCEPVMASFFNTSRDPASRETRHQRFHCRIVTMVEPESVVPSDLSAVRALYGIDS